MATSECRSDWRLSATNFRHPSLSSNFTSPSISLPRSELCPLLRGRGPSMQSPEGRLEPGTVLCRRLHLDSGTCQEEASGSRLRLAVVPPMLPGPSWFRLCNPSAGAVAPGLAYRESVGLEPSRAASPLDGSTVGHAVKIGGATGTAVGSKNSDRLERGELVPTRWLP